MSRLKPLTIIITIVIVSGWLFYSCVPFPEQEFESGRWRSGSKKVRGAMVRDIIGQKLLIGMSEKEVIELLGNPDHTFQPQNLFMYEMNNNHRCSFLWECHLLVYFDSETKKVDGVFKSD